MGNFWSSHLFPPHFLPKLGRFHFGLLWFILVYLLHFGPLGWFLLVYFGQFWFVLVYYSLWMIVNGGKKIIIHVRLSNVGHVRVTDSQQGQCIGYSPNSKVYTSKRKKKKMKKSPLPSRQALLSGGDFAWQWWWWYIFLLWLSWQWQWRWGDFVLYRTE